MERKMKLNKREIEILLMALVRLESDLKEVIYDQNFKEEIGLKLALRKKLLQERKRQDLEGENV
jgi:hypothetical protein